MAHGIPQGTPRPLIDVVHRKCLLQLCQQHLRRGPARLQPWRAIGHKGFVRMDMRLDKPWEHQLASHLEPLAGCSVELRGDGTNTPLLNGDVLLLSSDHTAVHNQIVHASSWRVLASVAQSLYPLLWDRVRRLWRPVCRFRRPSPLPSLARRGGKMFWLDAS